MLYYSSVSMKYTTVIPQDDGLMDLWIAGLLGLSSRKTLDTGF
jgi:hypothetical protein